MTWRKVLLAQKLHPWLAHGASLLDVGCGDGFLTKLMSNECKVLGVDLEVDIVKKRFPMLRFQACDITEDIEIGEYTIITCFDVMEHIESEFEERVLRKFANAGKRIILNIPEGQEAEQPIDRNVCVSSVISTFDSMGKELVYFEKWHFREETYNFMVFE